MNRAEISCFCSFGCKIHFLKLLDEDSSFSQKLQLKLYVPQSSQLNTASAGKNRKKISVIKNEVTHSLRRKHLWKPVICVFLAISSKRYLNNFHNPDSTGLPIATFSEETTLEQLDKLEEIWTRLEAPELMLSFTGISLLVRYWATSSG